ncbi:MAG: hypothetical protein SGARI_004085, partial [Bacillariaceae sp.]
MSTNRTSGSKRSHEGDAVLAPPMTDRMKLAEALKKETAIRFAKLQDRNDGNNNSYSKTLQTDDLVQVYPATVALPQDNFENVLDRDRWYFEHRKSRDSLKAICGNAMDGSLTPINIVGYEDQLPDDRLLSEVPDSNKDIACVPPNMLYFEIVLEAFMGYNLHGLYNSEDLRMPRAAVMGGAVLAALTSWRDEFVLNAFLESSLESILDDSESTVDDYVKEKKELTMKIHIHFCESETFNGDVDIFLQPSPFIQMQQEKLLPEVVPKISEYIGAQNDLYHFSKAATTKIEAGVADNDDVGELIYALTDRSLSFMLTTKEDSDGYGGTCRLFDDMLWPRTSQFIMLSAKADLVGALMDFDIAACSCAYNGV